MGSTVHFSDMVTSWNYFLYYKFRLDCLSSLIANVPFSCTLEIKRGTISIYNTENNSTEAR